ncbi:hypothetical protein CDAR_283161 [Caerostris darwini]|uniref:Uncharacterized protein n=1 Tax=Caerostris darwini TaxID=1538125 RepID=A0AAV4MFB6_9ARAC|nr:hypothetical protein CDAR_283161 [Caerostris darwini]
MWFQTYSLICVYSQYQEYRAGRGNPQVRINRPLPEVEYHAGKSGASDAVRIINDSGATNSSTISVGQSSSVPAVHSDINSTEESSVQCRNTEDTLLTVNEVASPDNCSKKNPEADGKHAAAVSTSQTNITGDYLRA